MQLRIIIKAASDRAAAGSSNDTPMAELKIPYFLTFFQSLNPTAATTSYFAIASQLDFDMRIHNCNCFPSPNIHKSLQFPTSQSPISSNFPLEKHPTQRNYSSAYALSSFLLVFQRNSNPKLKPQKKRIDIGERTTSNQPDLVTPLIKVWGSKVFFNLLKYLLVFLSLSKSWFLKTFCNRLRVKKQTTNKSNGKET